MSASLPRRPNLEHVKKSAKCLLAAQRQGNAQCCMLLRHIDRFANATDEEILTAELSLAEVQQLVTM
jgi:hypothetical protein